MKVLLILVAVLQLQCFLEDQEKVQKERDEKFILCMLIAANTSQEPKQVILTGTFCGLKYLGNE